MMEEEKDLNMEHKQVGFKHHLSVKKYTCMDVY